MAVLVALFTLQLTQYTYALNHYMVSSHGAELCSTDYYIGDWALHPTIPADPKDFPQPEGVWNFKDVTIKFFVSRFGLIPQEEGLHYNQLFEAGNIAELDQIVDKQGEIIKQKDKINDYIAVYGDEFGYFSGLYEVLLHHGTPTVVELIRFPSQFDSPPGKKSMKLSVIAKELTPPAVIYWNACRQYMYTPFYVHDYGYLEVGWGSEGVFVGLAGEALIKTRAEILKKLDSEYKKITAEITTKAANFRREASRIVSENPKLKTQLEKLYKEMDELLKRHETLPTTTFGLYTAEQMIREVEPKPKAMIRVFRIFMERFRDHKQKSIAAATKVIDSFSAFDPLAIDPSQIEKAHQEMFNKYGYAQNNAPKKSHPRYSKHKQAMVKNQDYDKKIEYQEIRDLRQIHHNRKH